MFWHGHDLFETFPRHLPWPQLQQQLTALAYAIRRRDLSLHVVRWQHTQHQGTAAWIQQLHSISLNIVTGLYISIKPPVYFIKLKKKLTTKINNNSWHCHQFLQLISDVFHWHTNIDNICLCIDVNPMIYYKLHGLTFYNMSIGIILFMQCFNYEMPKVAQHNLQAALDW